MSITSPGRVQFSQDAVRRFADWSHDRNPLHVDPAHARDTHFGRPVVHGMLTALETLSAGTPPDARSPTALDIEFRGAVFGGRVYDIDDALHQDARLLTLRGDDGVVLTLRVNSVPVGDSEPPDLSWALGAADLQPPGNADTPAEPALAALQRGIAHTGAYATSSDSLPSSWPGVLPWQARVLALCSYVVGMQVPGLRSLFTRATLRFHAAPSDEHRLVYRVTTTRFDRHFRLLDADLHVATSEGLLVATARLRSYVPFSPIATNNADLAARLRPGTERLRGAVALVCGASRGVGADIAAALAEAGCHVYAASRGERGAPPAVSARGGRIQPLQGDVGDARWCDATVELIHTTHGRLDLLVLNACAPPEVLRLAPDASARQEEYVRENLRLVQTPLAASLTLLEASQGRVVYLSSSYVSEPVAGFAAYIALKQAGEGLVRMAALERPPIRTVILRPPPLRTRWNDTPTGAAGAIPSDWVASHLVNRLGSTEAGSAVETLAEFRPFEPRQDTGGDVAPSTPASFSVRVAATFTADPLLAGLRFWMQTLEIDSDVLLAPYGQVLQSLLDPTSVLATRGKGLNVVLLRVRDWLRELPGEKVGDLDFLRGYLDGTARDFERAMRAHRSSGAAETLLLLCPSYDALASAENLLLRATESAVTSALAGVPGLQVVPASAFHEHYHVADEDVADPLRDHIAHIPYKDGYLHTLTAIIARHLHRKTATVRKVVVVDCDNTLWSGVVGEVGAEGVEFDAGHTALHQTLVRLTESGVLVCLCSKNEEPDVWKVFETRPELGLPRASVVAATINWQPKSQNMRTLAARLNLGLDSFIFLDDNPVECAEVRAGCPEVLTIQWPREPERAIRLLQHIWELDRSGGTKEDQQRTQLYREELRRQEARADTLTFDDFIKNLQLEVDFAPLAAEDLKRASQLTLRTNQFNFTTIRRDEAELQAVASDGRHEVRTVRVRDRFGDYGLVGLVIAERDGAAWTLDTFLLSCRVLGRGVEHRILADLGEMAAGAGAGHVRLRVDYTKRNTPARTFLESAIPEEFRHADEKSTACEIPAEVLRAVHFEPSAASGEVVADEADASASSQPADTGRTRRREEQIARVAFELSDVAGLLAAIEGVTRPAAPAPSSEADVAAVVYDAFAAALRVPAETVKTVDRLEALGCDSMRVVEITVALSDRFPWLPSTLLFERRSVSEIVAEIAALSSGRQGSGAKAISESTGTAGALHDSTRTTDVAVVGLHLRCAGANSADELWTLLSGRGSAVRPVPVNRDVFFHELADSRPHWAGLLDDVARFDAELFGVSPREAEVMDPQLRLFLEVAWGALEDAGFTGPGHQVGTGVFVGVMYGDYGYRANDRGGGDSPYRCWEGFSLANRLSQLLGFQGPSLAVDTACSSSATAIHLACNALRAGECRRAVVGGVNLILDPDRFGSLGRLGILSPDGKCEPFGADANGTVLGEGAGVVVLEPLEDALARGDRIYGVIKGTALSTGNGTVGFTAPNPQAQAEAIRRSLQAGRIDPRTISYVETHGTGTALGDPIEVRGLTLAFSDASLHDASNAIAPRCTLGSIKPNIGHLEAGAGVMGLIKVLLQLEHRALLPSITSSEPSPHIPFAETPFSVQRTLAPWERLTAVIGGVSTEVPRRAGLNSFGVGGANAHILVEEAPEAQAPLEPAPDRPAHVLALSARSRDALVRYAGSLADVLEQHPSTSIADVAFTINGSRKTFEHRAAVVASNTEEAVRQLCALAGGHEAPGLVAGAGRSAQNTPKVAFLFTGQGSQYAGMGRELYETQPVFRDALDRSAAIFDAELDRRLLDLLFAAEGSAEADLLNQTGYTQPALFAFEYALAQLWRSWGIEPHIVMGHSVGEIAAMCVAGAMSLEDGLSLIAARGRLMQALPAGGSMTSVMASEAVVSQALAGREGQVAIAAINAPNQIVISGVGSAVAEIAERLGTGGVRTKALKVSHAFHSPLMQPMLDEYARTVARIRVSEPRVPVVSCVTARLADREVTTTGYWMRQVMDPVRFADGMRTLEAEGVTAFVEIGPSPVLLGMGRQCVRDESAFAWLPSSRRDAGAWRPLLESLGRLGVDGAPIDWKAFDAPYRRRRAEVPVYAFGGRSYWLGRAAHSGGVRRALPTDSTSARPSTHPDVYEQVWREAPAPPTPADAFTSAILFMDLAGVGSRLVTALSRRGVRCLRVVGHGPFSDHGDDRFEIDASRPDDLGRLFTQLGPEAGRTLTVDLRALDVHDAGFTNQTFTGRLPGAVHDAADLVRASTAVERTSPVWFVTSHATAARSDAGAAIAVEQGSFWGFARGVSLEHPDLGGGIVDVSAAPAADEIDALAAGLLSGGLEDQAAIRGTTWYVPRLVRARGAGAGTVSLDGNGTYLVSGGTGALGLHVAEWLASRGARHLVLMSRKGMLDARGARTATALEARGVRVQVVAADVAKAQEVDGLMAAIAAGPNPLRGIVHAAGVDAVVPLASLTLEDVERVFAAKVTGGWLLHQRTRHLPLDLFVTFSSMASIVGAHGRTHYGAANAFLDALAMERLRLGLPVTNVLWGPWAGGGMATEVQVRQFERMGNRSLEPGAALTLLERLAGSRTPSAMVMDIDWSRFRPVYESRRPRPLLGELETQPAAPVAASGIGAADAGAEPPTTYSDWGRRLARVAPSHRGAELASLLTETVANTLGFDTPDSVPPDRSFYEIGMDSLMMADLVGRLKTRTGVSSSGLVFDHPTIEALAPRLLEALVVPDAEEAAPVAANVTPRPGQARSEEDLRQVVRAEVAATLGFARPDDVPLDQSFTSLGMDSLTSAELGSRLERQLGSKCSLLIFDYPSVEALAARLSARPGPISSARASSDQADGGTGAVPPAAAPRDGIRRFVPEDEDEILAFQAEGFPDRRGPVLPRRWRWAFVDSARRLGVEPRVWLCRDEGALVGQMASIPIKLKVGDTICDTGWLVDSMVLPSHRHKAIGTRLLVQAQEDQPFSLSLGQTAEVREICRRLGWIQVAPLQTAMCLMNADRVLRGKLPAPARWAAGIGLRAAATVRGVLKGRSAVSWREIERFGERHDALWACAAQSLACATVRDASYLNWKYVDRPGQTFLRLELLEGDALVGVAIWMFREPDGKYKYSRGFLVDVVAPLSDARRLEDVVRAASLAASERADALLCLHIGAALSTALHAAGFQAREPERFLLVDPSGMSEPERRILLTEQSWYVTQGDSDIDRP